MIDLTKFEGHTAGPWHADRHGRIKCVAGDVSREVADARGWGWLQYMPDGAATQDANARLIAAAPDLLAEVIRLRAALEGIAMHLSSDWPDRCQQHVWVARQALKGGTA